MINKQSKIEKLIARLCPQGVEFKALGEFGDFYGGLTGKNKDDFSNGNVKFITYMNIFSNISVDTDMDIFVKIEPNEKQNKIQYGDVLFTGSSENADECGMSSVLTKKTDEPLCLNSFCFGFRLHDINLFSPEFLKYLFRDEQLRKQITKTANGVTRFNVSKKRFAKIQIPIPPLPVQQEIVAILDSFTKLEAELEAELEARQKQYAYYRDELLSFDGSTSWTTLNKISKNLDSKRRPVKKSDRDSGDIPYYGASGIVDYVCDYIFDGDYLLVSEDGANLRARSTPIAFSISGKTWVNNHAHILEFQSYAERRFIEIYLNSIDLSMFISGGAQPKLNQANLNKIPIPHPPIREQTRIVDILDKFDALVNDISSGLPAEISARKKQYEYYRNKLLTFKDKNAPQKNSVEKSNPCEHSKPSFNSFIFF